MWSPSADRNRESNYARYLAALERERGLRFESYRDAWQWSTTAIDDFWASLWDFFEIQSSAPYEAVLRERRMPGAHWFRGARLNYAEHVFRQATPNRPALLFQSELRPLTAIEWDDLERQVASVAASLRGMGVTAGDRVVGYLPNIPETVVALLACASLGAIWSVCPPDFGTPGAVERFRQIEPCVLIAIDGYSYGGNRIDRRAEVTALRNALPSLRHTILIPYLDAEARVEGTAAWSSLLSEKHALEFEEVAFEHPLWVLYSSGTTGLPKAIVHGHGGIVLEHLKALALQNDQKPGDRFFWHTTTGWMMWNLLLGGLLAGCTVVLYDGSPAYPSLDVLWRLAQDARITRFGAGAAYFIACMKAGLLPRDAFDLTALRAVGATGSPLPPETYRWVYDAVHPDVWLAPSSGGTELCSSIVCGCPTLPVVEGEMQGPALGVSAYAFDEAGRPVVDEAGELVITEPLPSMPLYLWNDPGDARYRETYFAEYNGVWRHGDRVRFTPRGSAIIYGRSDATLNRQGVRIGTSEIYRAVETVPGIVDSLVVGVERFGGGYYMPLFVVLADGVTLHDGLRDRIRERITSMFSRRHLPDEIIQVPDIPRTFNGKKLEVPVKRILAGEPATRAVAAESVSNPESLDFFIAHAATIHA